jgi:hypothetical protein
MLLLKHPIKVQNQVPMFNKLNKKALEKRLNKKRKALRGEDLLPLHLKHEFQVMEVEFK